MAAERTARRDKYRKYRRWRKRESESGAAAVGSIPTLALSLFLQRQFLRRSGWSNFSMIAQIKNWLVAIDNLQNYCLGSSRGKSRLLRWLSRWLHSHLHGENDLRLHSSSVFPIKVAAVYLVVFGFLFSSLFWCRLETTGLFCANESAIKENQVSVFSLSDAGDIFCARSSRALPSWQPLRPFSHFSQRTLSFLHIFLFPVTSETASRSLSRGWRCSAVSRATLSTVLSIFTDWTRPVPSLADVAPTD